MSFGKWKPILARLRAGRSKFRIPAETKLPNRPRSPAQSPAHGYQGSFLGGLRGRDWPWTLTPFKNEWRYTTTPPICFLGLDRNNYFLPFTPNSLLISEKKLQYCNYWPCNVSLSVYWLVTTEEQISVLFNTGAFNSILMTGTHFIHNWTELADTLSNPLSIQIN